MRKNYVLLKRYGLALTLLLITTIIIYSCKKDNIKPTDAELMQQANQWFVVQSVISYSSDWDEAILTYLETYSFISSTLKYFSFRCKYGNTLFLVVNVSEKEIKGNIIKLFNFKNRRDISH